MAYTPFERKPFRSESATISIAPKGQMRFSAAACRVLQGAGIQYVILLWDSANGRMAIKGVAKPASSTFAITFSAAAGSFRAKSFLDYIRWRPTETKTLPTNWNTAEKMYEVLLPREYVNDRKPPHTEIADVMQQESRRGKRPIDIEERRKRATLEEDFRKYLRCPNEGEFRAAMRDELGVMDGSEKMEQAVQIWRTFR